MTFQSLSTHFHVDRMSCEVSYAAKTFLEPHNKTEFSLTTEVEGDFGKSFSISIDNTVMSV